MTLIRLGRTDDTPALVTMACRFIAESSYRGEVIPNPAHQARLVGHLLAHGVLFVAVVDDVTPVGFIAFALVPHVLSGELTACEIAWWVEPEWRRTARVGLRLLDTAEAWIARQGVAVIQMIAPVGNTRLQRLYERRGYRELETLWTRRLID